MALDYGRRRIGVAISDPLRRIASPHATVANSDPPHEPPAALLDMLAELEPALLLMGIPLNMDGTEGDMAGESRRFAARLVELTGLDVRERDERLTSVEAEDMVREMHVPRKRRRDKGLRDMLAATVLLRDYLEES